LPDRRHRLGVTSASMRPPRPRSRWPACRDCCDNAGSIASRQTMTKKQKKIEARLSSIHGNGVFAIDALAKGERVVRYKGLLRTHDDVDAAYADVDEDGHTFLFTLNDDYVIDANVDGNIARWINHSCSPNCEAVIEENSNGKRHKDKVYIEAIRSIKAGEELTYNYGITLDERHTAKLKKLWGCRCGSKDCTGTMLQPKR
jgi:SET domain-containing protein